MSPTPNPRLAVALVALLAATSLTALTPTASAYNCDDILDPFPDCVPCWDGGTLCPCPVEDATACACVTGACDIYFPLLFETEENWDGSTSIYYRRCNVLLDCEYWRQHLTTVPNLEAPVTKLVNQLPTDPEVVDHGNASLTIRYTQCDQYAQNCAKKNLTTTPNSAAKDFAAVYTPYLPPQAVWTPGLGKVCAPNNVVCAGPVQPIHLADLPGADPIPVVPASGASVAVTDLGYAPVGVIFTPVGPIPVTGEPVPITVCETPCNAPSGVTGGPHAGAVVTVYVGSTSKQIVLP